MEKAASPDTPQQTPPPAPPGPYEPSSPGDDAAETRRQLDALLAITDTALSPLPLDELLKRLIERTGDVMGVDNAALLLLDPDGQTLRVRVAHGLEEEVAPGVRVPFGQGFAGRVASTGKLWVVDDILSIEVVSPFLHERLRSIMGSPLIADGRTLGVVHVGTSYPRHFTPAEGRLLELVADRVARAIAQARLYTAERTARAEAERRAAQLAATFDAIADGVVVYDRRGRAIETNSAIRTLLGFDAIPNFQQRDFASRAQALNIRDEENHLLAPTDLPPMRAIRGASVTGDNAATLRMRTLDGREVELSVTASPLRAANGRITGAVGVYRDVTERRRLEREAVEREAQFRAIFEQAAVGIGRVGLDGHWLEVNGRLCNIVGYTREELLARTFQDITYPDDLETDLAYVRQLLAGEITTYDLEKRYIRKDGALVWINLAVTLARDHTGAPQYFISAIEDIAARKEAEAEVRQLNATLERRVAERTERLREANEALAAFAYSVSHDLRAPLRAMQGFAQALQEDYADALDALAREYTDRIVAAAQRMDQLIADLLAYSRLSRDDIQPRVVEMGRVVAATVEALAGEIAERRARVTVDEPLPDVLGHEPTVAQALTNLLTNALKFTQVGQTPEIRIWAERRTERRTERRGPAGERHVVRLWVEDKGIGVSPGQEGRIFQVFERLHSVEEYPGTGIGLAIVKKAAERMQGAAGVERASGDAPERGSRFWIELPAAREHGSEGARPERGGR